MLLISGDWTAPVGAVSSAIAAGAALVAIVYAKQAVSAGRDAIREERNLHIEQDYREFASALWSVRQVAHRARGHPKDSDAVHRLRDKQIELQSTFVMPRWVDLGEDAPRMMDTVLSHDSEPIAVARCASLLTAQLQEAWDRRVKARRASREDE